MSSFPSRLGFGVRATKPSEFTVCCYSTVLPFRCCVLFHLAVHCEVEDNKLKGGAEGRGRVRTQPNGPKPNPNSLT